MRSEELALRESLRRLMPWAVRYAVGRRTYVSSDVTSTIVAHADVIPVPERIGIIRDIVEAMPHMAQIDAREWEAALVALRRGTVLEDDPVASVL